MSRYGDRPVTPLAQATTLVGNGHGSPLTPDPALDVDAPMPGWEPEEPRKKSEWLDSFITSRTSMDEYTFIKTLGQGTFGKVKLAQHNQSGRKVAIKLIEKDNIKTDKQKTSVRREVRLLSLLHHRNIVCVHDVIETPTQICIVMEYLAGGELFDHIVKNHHLGEDEARRFVQQIVAAVDYCHQHSVIHRDLKPENLLLADDSTLKLIDFGFVNTFDGETLLDTFCGSPFYASPQMIRGIRYTGPESDVWSIAVILYAMLSGRLPFDAPDMRKLYDRIASGEYQCPSYFSPGVVDLLRKMLVVDPKRRYTVEQVKAHPWLQWPVPVAQDTRPMVPTLPLRRDVIQSIEQFGFATADVHQVMAQARTGEVTRHPILGYYALLAAGGHGAHFNGLWNAAAKRVDSTYHSATVSLTGTVDRAASRASVTSSQSSVASTSRRVSTASPTHGAPAPAPVAPTGPRLTAVSLKGWSLTTQHDLAALMATLRRVQVLTGVRTYEKSAYVYACDVGSMGWDLHVFTVLADASLCVQLKRMRGTNCPQFCSYFLTEFKRELDLLSAPMPTAPPREGTDQRQRAAVEPTVIHPVACVAGQAPSTLSPSSSSSTGYPRHWRASSF
ncbi:CAMK/CAMKL/AMPK protein kinase [Allomyces macrogynus ATCC 38327]|uniref:non-specific serine/threonine protein kinase n=1 Tax=Allomyces macrogynus (strain ATCC 38327) TaxID=578462 RepID=A0A0L0SRH6_ALLM3|nr:CAMK/CAMKL/AMPK protein kinase [Allomyces macrogynus ATCC 38327]|eukprot:KNE65163.1 CAMK/CAMKL/AMPK protein kinase [Allomyces macrogynus ATCC 38327]